MRGYTGRGYNSDGRRPYGYGRPWREGSKDRSTLSSLPEETDDAVLLVTDADLECKDGRIKGLGTRALWLPDDCIFKRSRPQSFVRSHQKEYREFTSADRSHSRNSWCSPCQASLVTPSPFSATSSFTTIRCAADRKMTGKDVAYFKALYKGRRLLVPWE